MRLDAAQVWIQKTVEGTFNTSSATGSDYAMLGTKEGKFILPEMEKLSDAERAGLNAPTHLCGHYWKHPENPFSDDVDTDVPARLFRRALGGSVTTTVVSAGAVWDHTFPILQPQVGDVLPSFGLAALLGSASYLLHGNMVDRFKVSAKGSERAVWESDIVGSGKFTNPHGLASLPDFVSPPCMDGFRREVKYTDTDGSTVVNLTSLAKLIEYSVEHKNNIRRNRRRGGDTVQTVGSAGTAAYVRKMPRGNYETMISMLLDFIDLTEWTKSVQNEVMTNLKFTEFGPVIAGGFRHEFEIIVPRFSFDTVTPGEDEGDAATPINVIALQDSVSKGTITGRIRNASATLV